MSALEVEHFALVGQLNNLGTTVDRHNADVDALEEMLADLALAATNDAMTEAMEQRQAAFDAVPAAPAAVPAGTGSPDLAVDGSGRRDRGGVMEMPDMTLVHGWVEDRIAPLVRKTSTTSEGGGIRWCREWWRHIDAVERFIALYLAWNELSTDDSSTWLSVFLRDHLDPHLATLTSPYGPFHTCTPKRHSPTGTPLGTAPQPATDSTHPTADHSTSPAFAAGQSDMAEAQ